jgi:hypothetical protein
MTDFKKAAKKVDRLYRERENYIGQADSYRKQAEYLRNTLGTKSTGYDELMIKAGEALAWSIGLQPEIERAAKELELSIIARKDW